MNSSPGPGKGRGYLLQKYNIGTATPSNDLSTPARKPRIIGRGRGYLFSENILQNDSAQNTAKNNQEVLPDPDVRKLITSSLNSPQIIEQEIYDNMDLTSKFAKQANPESQSSGFSKNSDINVCKTAQSVEDHKQPVLKFQSSNSEQVAEQKTMQENSSSKINLSNQPTDQADKKSMKFVIKNDNFQSVDRPLKRTFIDHLVVVHSRSLNNMVPIESYNEAGLHPEIYRVMESKKVNKLYRIQMFTWKYILENHSTFIVNAPQSGKKWSYLPPLCQNIKSSLTQSSYYKRGPTAIILVPSLKKVEEIGSDCIDLMKGTKNVEKHVVMSFGLYNYNDTKVYLLGGCGILIATPTSLLQLLKDNEEEGLIDVQRFQYFVVHDMHEMIKSSPNNFNDVIKKIYRLKKNDVRVLVTSVHWDEFMLKMMKDIPNPVLITGDFLEASVYNKIQFSIQSFKNDTKLNKLRDYLKKNWEYIHDKRIVVISDKRSDVLTIIEVLKLTGFSCLDQYKQSIELQQKILNNWIRKKNAPFEILVFTDDDLHEYKLQSADVLIHYSLSNSWTQFRYRYAALAKKLRNRVQEVDPKNKMRDKNEGQIRSLVLINEETFVNLPRLLKFLEKHNQISCVPKELLEAARYAHKIKEQNNISRGISMCPKTLEFGSCDEIICKYRHTYTEMDLVKSSDDMPTSGSMEIEITRVISPTHYVAKPLRHKTTTSNQWREMRRYSDFGAFAAKFTSYYADLENEGNLVLHWPLNVNDVCICKNNEFYQRVRILQIPNDVSIAVIKSFKVTVKLVDLGTITSCRSDMLFVCEDKFKDFPTQAIDIRFTNLVPMDNERSWSSIVTKEVQTLLESDEDFTISVNIYFAFADTIWVNQIIAMKYVESCNLLPVFNLKTMLIKSKIAKFVDPKDSKQRSIKEIAYELMGNQIHETIQKEPEATSECSNKVNVEAEIQTTDLCSSSVKNDDFLNASNTSDNSFYSAYDKTSPKRNNSLSEYSSCSSKDTSPSRSKIESWCDIPLESEIRVEIMDNQQNGIWDDIYLQNLDDESIENFKELSKMITNHVMKLSKNTKQCCSHEWFKPQKNCIIKYKKDYYRAKVESVFGLVPGKRLIRFFLCDIGCFFDAKESELSTDLLYETSYEIVTFTPFQAIHARLAGIKDIVGRHKVTKPYLFARVVSENIPTNLNSSLKIRSYNILLFEREENCLYSGNMLNQDLIDKELAKYDSETKHFLNIIIPKKLTDEGINAFAKCMEFAKENNSSDDEAAVDFVANILEGLNPLSYQSDTISQSRDVINKLRVLSKEKSKKKKLRDQSIAISDASSNTENLAPKSISKPPTQKTTLLIRRNKFKQLTLWYQNEYIIFLSINAPDVEDYRLEVKKQVFCFEAIINGEHQKCVLNLFGRVDPSYTIHQKRGLNIAVRLKKQAPYVLWPHLLHEKSRLNWLKYNLNAITAEDVPEQSSFLYNRQNHNTNSSDSDNNYNDDEEYRNLKTHNPIQNYEDSYDPMSETM